MTELPPIPLVVRTRLAHATLQAIADECGADILHIKGAAVHASLRPTRADAPKGGSVEDRAVTRLSADADVMVRPAHVKLFLRAMKRHGWHTLLNFDTGGGADHSTAMRHADIGEADVHRYFPGIRRGPDLAFELIWQERGAQKIAHRWCTVPSVDAQRLVLLLHAARNGALGGRDVMGAWTNAPASARDHVFELAAQLGAEVALASVIGHLDEFGDRPDHDLWQLLSTGGAGKFELWRARVKAAQTARDKLRVLTNPLRLKSDALALELQRTPTRWEMIRFYAVRVAGDVADVTSFAWRRRTRSQRHKPEH